MCQNIGRQNTAASITDPEILQKLTPREVRELKTEFQKYLSPSDVDEMEVAFSRLTAAQTAVNAYNGYVSSLSTNFVFKNNKKIIFTSLNRLSSCDCCDFSTKSAPHR